MNQEAPPTRMTLIEAMSVLEKQEPTLTQDTTSPEAIEPYIVDNSANQVKQEPSFPNGQHSNLQPATGIPLRYRYKSRQKANPLFANLQFAPVARILQNGSIYILFICGFTALVMKPSDPVWASTLPGVYCILLSIILYIWCFFSEYTKEDKSSVESILNSNMWPKHVRQVLSVINRNEFQCALNAM